MSLFSNRLYTLRKESNLSQEELVDYRKRKKIKPPPSGRGI